MTYEIIRNAIEVEVLPGGREAKTEERAVMERLRVGDAFIVGEFSAMQTARWARARLYPKRFSVRKLADGRGWQVRRTT